MGRQTQVLSCLEYQTEVKTRLDISAHCQLSNTIVNNCVAELHTFASTQASVISVVVLWRTEDIIVPR